MEINSYKIIFHCWELNPGFLQLTEFPNFNMTVCLDFYLGKIVMLCMISIKMESTIIFEDDMVDPK